MKRKVAARLIVLDEAHWYPELAAATHRLREQAETSHPWLRELTLSKLREAEERLIDVSFSGVVRA